MTQLPTLFVCALCKFPQGEPRPDGSTGGQHLIDQLATAVGDAVTVQPVRCMAACDRACNAALSAPGKLTYIFNDLSPQESAPELAAFCRQYGATADGRVPYGLRSPAIQRATAYVLPPLAQPAPSALAYG